jgi:fatty-acyl-CoA synthase
MIVDEENNVVPVGKQGEVLIRGHAVMHGYWGHEKKVKADYMLDNWYRTG